MRRVTDPPLRKCARIFLTGALSCVVDVDFPGHGRVLEDGNVTCEYSGEIRQEGGLVTLEKLRRNLPVMSEQSWALNTDRSLQLARTPMSPEERSQKHDLG